MTNRVSWFDRIFRPSRLKITMEETWKDITPGYSNVSFETMVTSGYRKNELIWACINKAANTAAQIGLRVYRESDGEEIPNHPLQRLIQRPNPFMSEFDLWAAVIIYLKLAGVAYFEKVRSRGGQVVQLWPLRPDWVTPIKSGNAINGYEYGPPSAGVEKAKLLPEDVLTFRIWDPLGMFEVYPPVAVAARVGDADNATTDYLMLFMQKGGTPPGILKTTQRLVDTQVADIRRRWGERYGGSSNWFQPAVLDADASYQQIGSSFKDMGFEQLDARSEARICMVLDVPPIIVGAKIGLDRATYSNYAEARVAWWEDSLIPMYRNFEDVIINQLMPEFGMGIIADWDMSKVTALQEDQNSRWSRATSALQAGAITVNEWREETGLQNIGVPGDVFLRTASMIPVPIGEMPGEEEPEPEPEVEPEPDTDEDEPEEEETEKAAHARYHDKARGVAPDDATRRKFERRLQSSMEAFFASQLERITRTVKALPGGEETKAPEELDFDFWEEEDELLYRALLPILTGATTAAAKTALDGLLEMGVGVDWALVNDAVRAYAKTYSYSLAGMINDTTQKVLQKEIPDWIASGQPIDALIDALTPTFGEVRARMVGVTEVTKVFAEGNQITWKESGVVDRNRWRTAMDELVCPICEPLEGMVVGLGDNAFTTEGDMGLSGPAAHINCRCWLEPVIIGQDVD